MTQSLKTAVLSALTDAKAQNVSALNVKDLSDVTNYMVIATGNSTTHIRAIARIVEEQLKDFAAPIGIEGEASAEWLLIDFGDLVLHLMLPGTREFYNLEKLWAPFDSISEALSA